MTYTVVLTPAAEGGYTVVVPALPGCVTEGGTVLEALDMARDAIGCHVGSLFQHGEDVPAEGSRIELHVEGLTEGLLFRVKVTPPAREGVGVA